MTKSKPTYIWHYYHNQLVTAIFFSMPIKSRRARIKAIKDPGEHALRLRLLKIVKGKIPDEITKFVERNYSDGRRQDLSREKSVIALHKKECKNCPWNGVTIFPIQED
ncbi:hypothetical protein LCGC14_2137550 [marine sediment metagenome]|uniref:Uncharacterized protein n=1 Tax=marine sediment metagenome TaxID=412755 RepID=A0A0F9DZL8_9ZZZZ